MTETEDHDESSSFNLEPMEWNEFFDSHEMIQTERGLFSTYFKNYENNSHTDGSILLCHHGAGMTALTFSLLASHLPPSITLIAFDARSHGLSPSNHPSQLSLASLSADLTSLVNTLRQSFSQDRPIILVGHSLGGAVCTLAARRELVGLVAGLIVIDIVEETALRSLPSMEVYLRDRPQSFNTISEAIDWALHSRIHRNPVATRISLPSQLTALPDGTYGWRIDLSVSKPYWGEWFKDLSSTFVAVGVPKLLVLAEREYLDRTLMISSMMGQFQCSVVRDSGHLIQEDQPEILARIIEPFIQRITSTSSLSINCSNSVSSPPTR